MRKSIVNVITRNAIVAAMYFLFTFLGQPFSFGVVQVRLAEALILLCFFRRDFTIVITLGCLLSNLFSPFMPWDLLIGTGATLISCLLISYCKHLLLASFIPVIINAFAVSYEIIFIFDYIHQSFYLVAIVIGIGELLAVSVVGYVLCLLMKRNKSFMLAIGANRNIDFKW